MERYADASGALLPQQQLSLLESLQEQLQQLQEEKASLETQLEVAQEKAICSSFCYKQQLEQIQVENKSLAQQLNSSTEQLVNAQSNSETLANELQSTLLKLDDWSNDALHPGFLGN
jgi:chromosome segregation ATPase